jgi:hypothetical protein
VSFDSSDHGGLGFLCLVVVDDTDASEKLGDRGQLWALQNKQRYKRLGPHRHRNGHLTLSDRVHWATHEGRFENNIARDATFREDIGRGEVDFSWKHQEIIVSEATMDLRVYEVGYGEAI